MDARIRHTKSNIARSFLSILENKDISKITVTEICKLADVNRATFYKYYEGPEDLLNRIEEEHLNALGERLQKCESINLDVLTRIILEDVKDNHIFYRLFFVGTGYDVFKKKFIYTLQEIYCGILKNYFPDLEDNKIQWLYFFIMSGMMGVFTSWLENGRKESFDEVLNFSVDFINRNIKGQHI